MMRVVRRVINHKYRAVSLDMLKEGLVPFDCYIKRMDDFVIIIEAGSYITGQLLQKMALNPKIYVSMRDIEKVKEYYPVPDQVTAPLAAQEMVNEALKLPDTLSAIGTYKERLSIVYETVSGLMQTIFETQDERLPLDAVHESVIQLVKCIDSEIRVMPILLTIIPDEYSTHHHSTNVALFAVILASVLKLPPEEILDIAYAGLLHDIGKLRVDKKMLLKSTSLEEDEYEIVQQHSEYGYRILLENGISSQRILNGVRFHHEKLDGTGYPQHLRAKLIPKIAKIIGICDVFDALTTKRTFRSNYSSYEAIVLMKQEMSSQFEEHYIDTFIHLLRS